MDAAYNLLPPECYVGALNRENQLGNDASIVHMLHVIIVLFHKYQKVYLKLDVFFV